MRDIPFAAAADIGSIQNRIHPLDVGFDLRVQGLAAEIVCEAGAELRVSYADRLGDRRVVAGDRREVIAHLRSVGYAVQPVIHWHTGTGVYGYDDGDLLVDEAGNRVRAVRTGAGIQLEPA